ncbi:dicarboxylate/amino acid:cation symporter [Bacillus alveayuensis]|uniref:Na+/H+-dicarboxylate symporter n=1 Tax=Aeribacillus alveayuensis TaxID=279215 RepID=A0ABT9VJC7_9BACI|nr:dicarboxylate/amino acid:cation symporter [Bacillus alveayuensis]MDQ0160955.1 Na+/H+-dicarboxylate symporter [Bacillus alveayuensis]
MLRKFGLLPRIITAIILGILIGSISPQWLIKIFSTFNGIFGNFLGFVIPLIIIGFIAPGIAEMGKGAGKMLGITTLIAYGSTITAGLLAFVAGLAFLPSFISGYRLEEMENPEEFLQQPFFQIDMPPLMGVMSALLLSFILGIGMAVIKGDALQQVFVNFRQIIEKLISKVIIPLLPFHIFGIFANMTYGGQVAFILSVFAKVFALIIALHITMLFIQYVTSGAIARKNPLKLLKVMLPAYFTALGTQSSAATIPVTLRQVKQTGVQEKVADFTVPLLATIHLSGSTITLVSCAMGVILLNGQMPDFASIFPFILMLGITMIAAPGVPGGAVMASLGLLESMLGFNQTMLTLMIALYLAQDSFGTATNVTGDGALTVLVNKITKSKKEQALSA